MMPSTLTFWINVIGYQVVWFAAIIGGGRGLWWPGVAAAAVFILQHLATSHRMPSDRAIDVRLLAVALLIGVLLDGSLARSGLADYAGDTFALPSGGAPLWILALWASFALTLRHSMFVLVRRPAVAFVVGAVFGPLAYLGAGQRMVGDRIRSTAMETARRAVDRLGHRTADVIAAGSPLVAAASDTQCSGGPRCRVTIFLHRQNVLGRSRRCEPISFTSSRDFLHDLIEYDR